MSRGYVHVRHEDPPQNPASRDVGWADAIVWTLLVGAVGGLARLLVNRALAPTPIPAEGDGDSRELPDLPFLGED